MPADQNTPDDADVADLIRELWRSKLIIGLFVLAGAAVATGQALLVSPKYRATIMVLPLETDGGTGAMGSLASQFGGIASLAGISLGGSNKRGESVAVLQSDALIANYITTRNLLPVLFPERWDSRSSKWRVSDRSKIPTMWLACKKFSSKIRTVVEDRKSGMVELTIEWTDPKQAAQWANGLVELANAYLRDKTIQEAQRNIAYLTEQANKTDIVDARRAIFSLLEQEINKEMVARGRDEYALKIIDPAMKPEKPSTLPALIRVLLGAIIGGIIGAVAVMVRRAMRS
jgi:LPS O-antigen subunit length determinant protein (WzzB/FepE family)